MTEKCLVCEVRECAKGCDMCQGCIDDLLAADEEEWTKQTEPSEGA